MEEFNISPEEIKLFYGEGCSHCKQTGYKGRTAIFELMVINESIRELIYKNAPLAEIRETAIKKNGMISLKEDGLQKVSKGITTLEEVMRATST
jgi:type IV pilus assembly protein PilB